ncbi:MAG: hypothetical protein WC763_07290 [Candidatus Paceibacterota bacterium]|jgi:hypothetical protein
MNKIELRFVPEALYGELINNYHLARGLYQSRYERIQYAVKYFCLAHPEISYTGAYKDLSASLDGW